MTKEHNNVQDVCIAEIKKDCSWMKQEISSIKTQVFNHLPHQIDDTRKERMEQIKLLTKEITELKDKIMMSFLVGIVSVVVVQILLKLFY
jgi:hypothetical protein